MSTGSPENGQSSEVVEVSHALFTGGGTGSGPDQFEMDSTGEPQSVTVPRSRTAQRRVLSSRDENRLVDVYAVKTIRQEALEALDEMDLAVEDQSPLDLGIAGNQFNASMNELWDYRHVHGDDWATVLNFLQMALTDLEYEAFGSGDCDALRRIVERHLTPSATFEDAESTEELLEQIGLTPLKGIDYPHDTEE